MPMRGEQYFGGIFCPVFISPWILIDFGLFRMFMRFESHRGKSGLSLLSRLDYLVISSRWLCESVQIASI